MNNEIIRKTKSFDELLDIKYGKTGDKKREKFEKEAEYFVISETQKETNKLLSQFSVNLLIREPNQ